MPWRKPCASPSAAMLFVHGGGFIGGPFEAHELPLRALGASLGLPGRRRRLSAYTEIRGPLLRKIAMRR